MVLRVTTHHESFYSDSGYLAEKTFVLGMRIYSAKVSGPCCKAGQREQSL